MLFKSLFLICVTMVLQCSQQSMPSQDEIATNAWIRDTLFKKNSKSCAKISSYPEKAKDFKPNRFYSWTVVILIEEYIETKMFLRHQCTGSLIGLGVVLTSASCIGNVTSTNIRIRAGESKSGIQNYQERRVQYIKRHENFSEDKLVHDIALIFLVEPFTQNESIKTVCRASGLIQKYLENVICSISGWIARKHGVSGKQNFQTIDVTVKTSACQNVLRSSGLGENYILDESNMCAMTEGDIDMLLANGGAPLICTVCAPKQSVIQVGVLSYAFETSALPFVLTAVHQHERWIDSNCKGLCDSSNC